MSFDQTPRSTPKFSVVRSPPESVLDLRQTLMSSATASDDVRASAGKGPSARPSLGGPDESEEGARVDLEELIPPTDHSTPPHPVSLPFVRTPEPVDGERPDSVGRDGEAAPGIRRPSAIPIPSRPSTARSGGSSHSHSHSRLTSFVLSIIHTGNVRRVGIAALNQRSTKIFLTQHTETSHTAESTINLVREYDPVKVIFPSFVRSNRFVDDLRQEFPGIKLVFVSKKFYNESKGFRKLQALSVQNEIVRDVQRKSLAVSAFSALVDYFEATSGSTLALNSFDIRYKSVDSHLMIDSLSVRNLELLSNLKDGSREDTLFSSLDLTTTPMGRRLLRTTLLQPLTSIEIISDRQNAIADLLACGEAQFGTLSAALGLVAKVDVDQVLSRFVVVRGASSSTAASTSSKHGEKQLKDLILLKDCILSLQRIRDALRTYSDSALLKRIYEKLSSTDIEGVQADIDSYIDTEIRFTSNALTLLTAKVFAIHQGKSGMLDVARRVYSDAVTEVHALRKSLMESTGIENLILRYTNHKGYYFLLNANEELPPRVQNMFVTYHRRGRKIQCTTQDLMNLNRRISSTLDEIYRQSDKVLLELVTKIRERMLALSHASEGIAIVDMLCAFSQVVISTQGQFNPPRLTETGPVAIRAGRHPVLSAKADLGNFVPNDTYVGNGMNFQIITGPNNSGKSTYIRQVALLVILAHMGCYVPAEFCSTRIFKRIFTKLSLNDDSESNCSTFMVEMREISHIVQNATNESMILIDELGRGTSHVEGSAIAWAISEFLLNLDAFTLFVTHHLKLCSLSEMYPNVRNFHLQVDPSSQHNLRFNFKLAEGSTSEDRYGLRLARLLGMPRDLLADAEETLKKLSEAEERRQERERQASGTASRVRLRQCYEVGERIARLKFSSLDLRGKMEYLRAVKLKLGGVESSPQDGSRNPLGVAPSHGDGDGDAVMVEEDIDGDLDSTSMQVDEDDEQPISL